MRRSKEARFGQLIRARRRELDLTREELARRIKASITFVGYLETGKRGPSTEIVARLANVLGFDMHELFSLLHPHTDAILNPEPTHLVPYAWEQFENDRHLQRLHRITRDEMEMLSRVALLGEVRSAREYIYILNAVRKVVGR